MSPPRLSRSAGGVVVNRQGKILVVNQRGTSWSLPKGHLEAGEDTLTAARREIYEESGLSQLTLVKPLGTYQRPRRSPAGGDDAADVKELTFFLFRTDEVALKPIDPDNPEARWVDPEAVAPLLSHPRDQEFFRAILGELPGASAIMETDL